VQVIPNPTCVIAPVGPVCGGTTNVHTSTVSPAGGTVTHNWSITGNGTIVGSTTGPSVTVIAGASGSYTVTDNITRDGCPGVCSVTVTVIPNPTCVIAPVGPVCGGTTNVHTSTVSPAGGTVTHSWSITGNGTIVGSTTGSSVTVIAGASGSYTLTDNIVRDGCPGVCSVTVTVNPNPTCVIAGPTPVNCVSTNVYTSTVSPASGVVTHNWSITGNGTIIGSTTGASVTVVVNSPSGGSFTLTDNITRDGCPGVCTLTVPITPCPPCIDVTKQIACFLGTNVAAITGIEPLEPGENCGPFGKVATGIQGDTQDPAFCYSITVSNCGPVALTNVTVIDDMYGDLSSHFPANLAIGAVATFTFKAELSGS
jgi:hypothetical protein